LIVVRQFGMEGATKQKYTLHKGEGAGRLKAVEMEEIRWRKFRVNLLVGA
jgi:hypothetical protein